MARPTSTRRVPVDVSAETAGGSWLRGLRFSGFGIVMMAIVILAIVVLAPTFRIYLEQRQQIAGLEQAVAAQQAEVDALRAERERWNDKSFIMSQARDRLYYVLPGEVSFLVINDIGEADPSAVPAPVSTDIQTTQVDWVTALFASTMTAGLAPVAVADPAPPVPEGAAG